MTPESFFRRAETLRILRWAGQAAAVSIAVHTFEQDREQHLLVSFGRCAACGYIAGTAKGPTACRHARETAVADLSGLPVAPFICPVGFACVSAMMALDDSRAVLTFGPYCPAEEPRALECDFMNGLRKLESFEGDRLPVDLTDVQCLPVTTVPAVAEQAVRMLREHWMRTTAPQPRTDAETTLPARRTGRGRAVPDAYNGAALAAAMAAGARDRTRALVRVALDQARAGKRASAVVLRSRAIATAAAAIDCAARAGSNTEPCRQKFPEFLESVNKADTAVVLATLVVELLHGKRARPKPETPGEPTLHALHQIVSARLHERVTLGQVAALLDRHPTAITHFLQRNYGWSFTEYVGRLRIDMAKELVRRTNLDNNEIARRVGLNDLSNFAKLFKKFELVTPAEYRARFPKSRPRKKCRSKAV